MVLQGKCERHRDREMGHRQKKESEETADREGETEGERKKHTQEVEVQKEELSM